MKTKSYPLRIPSEILDISRLRAKEEHLDQSTALRQFMHLGAEEYVLRLVKAGRISVGKAAELLNGTVYDLQNLAQRHGIAIGATLEQSMESRKTARKVLK